MLGTDIGIDLGTANVIVFVRGKGIVISEPAVVAMETNSHKVWAIGSEARRMVGRTPGDILAIRPLRNGVIADYQVTEIMLKYFIKKAGGKKKFFRPRVVICVPTAVTTVEKRAVLEAAYQAAARDVYLISEPMAAAIGCGLDVHAPQGNLAVDIGGGTTDIAVISLGGEVVSESIRVGGSHFEEAIVRHVKREYNIAIGETTAEEIKIRIGIAHPKEADQQMDVKGRDLVSGLPCTITLYSRDVYACLEESVTRIVEAIKGVLEITPPELSADILDRGMVLTGGGALMRGMGRLIKESTGVPVHIGEDPLTCVARGTGKVLQMLDSANRSKLLISKLSG